LAASAKPENAPLRRGLLVLQTATNSAATDDEARRVEGPIEVSISLGRLDNRKRDLDDTATKAALDLLPAHFGD
jgi:hypothetical protein